MHTGVPKYHLLIRKQFRKTFIRWISFHYVFRLSLPVIGMPAETYNPCANRDVLRKILHLLTTLTNSCKSSHIPPSRHSSKESKMPVSLLQSRTNILVIQVK